MLDTELYTIRIAVHICQSSLPETATRCAEMLSRLLGLVRHRQSKLLHHAGDSRHQTPDRTDQGTVRPSDSLAAACR